jgi:hypothetical protein
VFVKVINTSIFQMSGYIDSFISWSQIDYFLLSLCYLTSKAEENILVKFVGPIFLIELLP